MLVTENQKQMKTDTVPTSTSATLKNEPRQKSSGSPTTEKPREIDLLASVFSQMLRSNLPKLGVLVRYTLHPSKPNTMIAEFSGVVPCQNCKDIFPAEVMYGKFCPTCQKSKA